MTTDIIPNRVSEWLAGVDWMVAVPAAGIATALFVAVLIAASMLLRRLGRGSAATKVTTTATLLGMAWSAQGMWDTAVHHYGQSVVVASVLFVVFEAFLAGRMLRAHQYRRDFARRGKFITAVWTGAVVMAAVVALGEGWSQAPGRLAIPLLVAYGWYTDLTADDDPRLKPKTSWRLTPRRALLAIGVLEPGERDAQTIDRDRLRDRLTKLAFRIKYGSEFVNDAFRRPQRLAKLKTLAEDADLAEVRARLARMSVDLMADPAPEPPQPTPEVAIPDPKPKEATRPARPPAPDDRLPQGVHMRDGRILRGPELEADAVLLVRKSIAGGKRLSIADLAAQYTPPLKQRTAEKCSAAGGRAINGSAPKILA
jgi:hypothetical protein